MADNGESLPITPELFTEFERMLEDALWALSGFPSEPPYTRQQLDVIDSLMSSISEETHRIKVAMQYRRQVLKRQRLARVAESDDPGNAKDAQKARDMAVHLAEVHGLTDVPVAGLYAAHMHSFGAHPEQARDSCSEFVRPSVAYHVMVLIARNAAASAARTTGDE
jgi:hypothetical protein